MTPTKAEDHTGFDLPHYYVDEAGDPTLFGKGGGVLAGSPGCSRCFMMGFLHVAAPEKLQYDLDQLRQNVLKDPYFQDVPSLQPERRKTYVEFHAKDDLPEIRKMVFDCLLKHDIRFHAVVRDKSVFVNWVKNNNRQTAGYRYHPNKMYDELVKRLFRDHLHKHEAYQIFFAQRGSKDRSKALADALVDARRNFAKKWDIVGEGKIDIHVTTPERCVPLQAVDYFLWALQRCYERREDRYIRYLWPKVRRIHDVDDRRKQSYGTYYSQNNSLEAAKLPDAQ